MSIVFKFLERESTTKVLEFFNTAQGDKIQNNNRPKEEFEWLFFNGYYKPALYTLATEEESDDIIGTYAGIFIPMIDDKGNPIITIKGEDTLISLDKMIKSGKRDLLKELLSFVSEKSKDDNAMIFWGFSNARAAYRRCGFQIVAQIKGSFYVTKPLKFFQNRNNTLTKLTIKKKAQLFAFAWFNFSVALFKSATLNAYGLKRIDFSEIDENKLLSFLPEGVYATHLNKEFLRWRVNENPSPLEYGYLEFSDKNNRILAYFIFSSNPDRVFFIEQFLFDHSLTDNQRLIIMKQSLNYCRKQKAIMIRALGLNHNKINSFEMKLLTRAGFYFFHNPEESYFVFKDLSGKGINPGDVYLSRLNTQGIR